MNDHTPTTVGVDITPQHHPRRTQPMKSPTRGTIQDHPKVAPNLFRNL